jgi:DNA-directed RNA polymerase subunit RPC12/RpoP
MMIDIGKCNECGGRLTIDRRLIKAGDYRCPSCDYPYVLLVAEKPRGKKEGSNDRSTA